MKYSVWNLTGAFCNFGLIMVMSLNFYLFTAILSYRKRKELDNDESVACGGGGGGS
jgi:hypothetical protein